MKKMPNLEQIAGERVKEKNIGPIIFPRKVSLTAVYDDNNSLTQILDEEDKPITDPLKLKMARVFATGADEVSIAENNSWYSNYQKEDFGDVGSVDKKGRVIRSLKYAYLHSSHSLHMWEGPGWDYVREQIGSSKPSQK